MGVLIKLLEVHFTFVDMEKAWDTVPLQKLWEALEDMKIEKNSYQGYKKNLYKNAVSKIKIGKFLTEEIKTEKSLRLGYSKSPTQFKIVICSLNLVLKFLLVLPI